MTAPATRSVDIGGAIGYGWRKLQDHIGPLLLAGLIVVAVNVAVGLVLWPLGTGRFALLVRQVANFVVGAVILIGWVRMALRISRGDRPDASDILRVGPYMPAALVAALLFGLLNFVAGLVGYLPVLGGLVEAVARLWLLVSFGFWSWVLVDRNAEPAAALRGSFEITAGHRWQLLLLWLALILLNIVGLLLLVVGVLFTLAISLLAVTFVYRNLSGDPVE